MEQRRMISRDAGFQIRENESGHKMICGYFIVFDGTYDMGGGIYEQVDRHALDDTINDDIRALINHDDTLVIGRTAAGTLRLSIDDHGVYGEIDINDLDTDATNIHARVSRGDVSQCSFGFEILDETPEYRDDGTALWTLRKVKLYEVSVCTFPAYPTTEVEARKADIEAHNKRRRYELWRHSVERKLNKQC